MEINTLSANPCPEKCTENVALENVALVFDSNVI